MAILETTVSAPTPGAARTLDMAYPQPNLQTAGNNTPGVRWIDRQAYAFYDTGTVTAFGVPPLGTGWDVYRGRVAYRQTGGGASGGFYLSGADFAITFPQTKERGAFPDDFACWRVTLIAAFDSGVVSADDAGLEIAAAMNYDVSSLSPGFRLCPTGDNAISFQVRQVGGAAFTIDQVVATPSVLDWNAYELRFIGATDTTEAVVKAFVNGVQVAAASYGAGTVLPSMVNGTSIGYMIGVGNRGAPSTYLAMCGLTVQAAATESGLL